MIRENKKAVWAVVGSFTVVALVAATTMIDYNTQVKNGPVVGDTNPNYTTFAAACAGAVALHSTLSVAKVWANQATASCAANLTFNGGSLQPGSGQALTLTGTLTAPLVQIFDLSSGGTVAVASVVAPSVYPQWWGARGDGTTNNSFAIQSAVNSICSTGGSVRFVGVTQYYLVTSGTLVTNCRNVLISGDAGTEIRVQAGYTDTPYTSWPNFGRDSIFRILDSTNITVEGLTLNGNLSNRTANPGAESMNSGVLVAGSTNVIVRRCVLKEGMTDGALVTYDATHVANTNTWITDSQLLNSRRNNISGVAQIGLYIKGNTISGAGTIQGTNPKSNIDIEPDYITSALSQDVHVEGNTLTGAAGTYALSAGGYGTAGLIVANNSIHDNAASGANFDSYDFTHLNTDAVFTGNSVFNNGGIGVRVALRALDILSLNKIRNNSYAAALYSPDGLLISQNAFESNLNGAIFNDHSLGFVKLSVQGNTFRDNNSALGVANGVGWVLDAAAASGTSTLAFDGNLIYGSAGASYLQKGVQVVGSCQCRGGGNTAYNVQLPTSFLSPLLGAGNHVYGASALFVDQVTSGANFSPNNGGGVLRVAEKQITAASAVPSSGTWNSGDVVFNSAPSSGGPMGWICTVTGTPGTWVPLAPANLLGAANLYTSPFNTFTQSIFLTGGALNNLKIYAGAGSPAGVLAADPGSLYLNTSGGAGATLFVKESGTGPGGWVAK